MRIYLDGVETYVPARWFWAEPGAKIFPSPHGMEASPWLDNYEHNRNWGEVTPYPRYPLSDVHSILDAGLNPGYPGLCYVGERQWFNDGHLPRFEGPAPPYPPCCRPTPAVASGSLVIQGVAQPSFGLPFMARGDLILAGQGVGSGPILVTAHGDLILAGQGVGASTTALAHGDLIIWGVGVGGKTSTPPGDTCDTASDLPVGVSSGSWPGNGYFWYRVYLTAGIQYAWRITSVYTGLTGAVIVGFAGPCGGQVPIVGTGSCETFTPLLSGWYYVSIDANEVQIISWEVTVSAGSC